MKETKYSIKEYWNWRSKSYPQDSEKSPDVVHKWQSIINELVADSTGRRALDMGTGNGQLAMYLARAGFDVTGVDISEEMVSQATKNAAICNLKIDFKTGDAEHLDFEDNSFDVITARNLLWTLPDPDTALSEWRRVLKPKGKLIVSDGLWMNTTWKHLPRRIFKSFNINGAISSLRFFFAYAGLHKSMPFYEGICYEHADLLLKKAEFKNVVPYDTEKINFKPYQNLGTLNNNPSFFIAHAEK